ncbi:MAG: hypothetical protein NW241_14750 [Bacteroidia bacterium]|nr:hypothetical protein [Bacteroidia bacterium]
MGKTISFIFSVKYQISCCIELGQCNSVVEPDCQAPSSRDKCIWSNLCSAFPEIQRPYEAAVALPLESARRVELHQAHHPGIIGVDFVARDHDASVRGPECIIDADAGPGVALRDDGEGRAEADIADAEPALAGNHAVSLRGIQPQAAIVKLAEGIFLHDRRGLNLCLERKPGSQQDTSEICRFHDGK